MAASLHHAQTVLSAAINSGFRESGIQSLKNLDDPNSFPMIAIRSSGLALESVVGAQIDEDDDIEDEVYSIVSEDHLKLLIKLANGRFKTNTERMKRFEDDLFGKEARREMEWEDGQARKERKRAEGLAKQNGLRKEAVADIGGDYSLENGTLFGALPMI